MQEVVRLTSVRNDRGRAEPARAWMSFQAQLCFVRWYLIPHYKLGSASWQREFRVGHDFVANANLDR